MISQYIRDLKQEFKGYNSKKLSKDIVAGLTVAAVALPLALAFGVSSGADAAAGLITAIISGIIIGGLSGGSYQISGPTGTMTAILLTMSAKFGIQGIFIVTFLAGIVRIIASVLKLGRLVSFIPGPVITGFTSGIALIIALGQVDNFFGVTSKGDNTITKLLSYGELGFHPNLSAVLIGVVVIAIMVLWPKKWGAKVPSSLVAIAVAVILNYIFTFDVGVVGKIPTTLLPENRLDFAKIPFDRIGEFIMPAISVAALGMIETLLCGASAGKMKGEKLNADRELMAQGIGNMIIPFFGGIPATAALARSSMGIKSGSQTRLTSVFHALGLLACMFLLGPIMSNIPLSALAGVLWVTSWRMNEFSSIKYIFKNRFKSSITKYLITMVATVVLDLNLAIIIGVTLAILMFVVKISDINVEISTVDENKLNSNGISINKNTENVRIIYITGPVFFGTVEKISETVSSIKDPDVLIFSMRGVPFIDAGGAMTLFEQIMELEQKNIKVMFCGVQPKVKTIMDRAGITEYITEDKFYWDAQKALHALNKIEL